MVQKRFWVPLCLGWMLGFVGVPQAQQLSPQGGVAAVRAGQAPTDSDIYCAGFFTRQPITPNLVVLSSEDGGFKNEYADRDIIYLNKGRQMLSAPGGLYMLVRPVKDVNSKEFFSGQRQLISQLGTLYAEVGRIQVRIVHEASATAEILQACEPILAGDIAIPFVSKPVPPYRSAKMIDRFAPASGKPTGIIVTAKEFQSAVGEGNIVYLNIGRNQGAQVGGYFRIFRTPLGAEQDPFEQAADNYATELAGVPTGRKLTHDERASLPRKVLGEIILLSVQEESSTGILTFSREEVFPGDAVELE
ncbi:MAG: hypothetical protein HY313_09365 [Acidobacteria bacterium]|nr:hypothetical protein [Acidobacteriota bacterium]